MPRNLDRRVEALAPVTDDELRGRLQEILDVNLADDMLAWELLPDGRWRKVPTVEGVHTHRRLQEQRLQRTRDTLTRLLLSGRRWSRIHS